VSLWYLSAAARYTTTLIVVAEKRDSVLDEQGREAVALAATPPVQAIRYAAAGK